MKARTITITAPDYARLSKLIASSQLPARERTSIDTLERELQHARIVAPGAVPPDVITMNSRAKLQDLDTGDFLEFTVVYPGHTDPSQGRISVLAPVGAGMLGFRVGDVFERPAPDGIRRMKVLEVLYQPEAALASAA